MGSSDNYGTSYQQESIAIIFHQRPMTGVTALIYGLLRVWPLAVHLSNAGMSQVSKTILQ